ncbi:MAG: putative transcriptional regulator, GntR family protein [Amycolatopsis sp.]|uniref:GntR family transcriptional regulator n=1 Tax=Amycolatopsis sp. TaxID=37632 RepID=UPI00262B148D|nr:GntR family transcriptional regulator [Amycolatopsis sp.]MCU1680337.1 putative transcriptional regulator, GntR family protein [Amycolatopsis sp.]
MVVTLQTTSTRDALVAEVRKQILSGELRPGETLTENALATTFGVARPTVRSALQVLVGRNLVRQSGGRSLTVPELTDADVRDLFFVRTPLELEAVRVIIENGSSLASTEERLAEMEALPADASWGERVETHTAFHLALVDAAGSTRLSRIYPAMQEEMQLCLAQLSSSYPGSQDLAREHRDLLDAIRSGDIERARTEMGDHLGRALGSLTA